MAVSKLNPVSGGVSPKVFKYTTTGLSTFTLPSGYGVGNPLMAEVTILAGGGSAGKGFYASSTSIGVAGGGGAGGALKTFLSLTSDINVHVGKGGICSSSTTLGGNGEYSYIGTSTPKNLFINPQFLGYGDTPSYYMVGYPFESTTTVTTSAAAVRGATILLSSFSSNSPFHGQTYAVKASTSYTFSLYGRITSGAAAFRLDLVYFTSDGTSISTTSGSTFTCAINTWNRAEVGGTSPSTAAYCTLRITRISGTTEPEISNAQFEEGVTTASTYVDGDSTGYVWAGVKTGSATLLASDTMYIANGGGGGAGIFAGTPNSEIIGFSGGCSGGGALKATTSSNRLLGGNGGGLGGHAEKYFLTPAAGATATNSTEYNYYNKYADFNFGSSPVQFTSASKNNYIGSGGIADSDGYGKGGSGSRSTVGNFSELLFQESTVNAAYLARAKTLANGRNNFGDGGSALNIGNLSSGTLSTIEGNGGSGLVIIKYWS